MGKEKMIGVTVQVPECFYHTFKAELDALEHRYNLNKRWNIESEIKMLENQVSELKNEVENIKKLLNGVDDAEISDNFSFDDVKL